MLQKHTRTSFMKTTNISDYSLLPKGEHKKGRLFVEEVTSRFKSKYG